MAHTFTNLLTHVVFSTRERAPLISTDLKPRLYAYMGGIIRELKGKALAVNGTSDHVHLLVSLPPGVSVSDAMRVLKTNSSRWANDNSQTGFAWQAGYGAFSVSKSNARAVSEYIARQEDHHRVMTFQEEFKAFLQKHGIEYDEQHLWN